MSRYKYTVKMIYNDGGENFTIGPEHIPGFVIDYAYTTEVIQPLIMVKANLDKNFIDRMIKNKANAKIQFIVQKINISVDVTNTVYEDYINTVCFYELMDDLYNEKTLLYDKEDVRKDIFAQTTLGLTSATLIDRNTKSFDCILKGGNMMGAVCYFTAHMPMIIEPFDHNILFEKELIVPPNETIKQMMDFLNSVHVFYNTNYRLYFDFNCTYLLSMKGIATPAKGEEYSRVTIRVVEPKEDAYDAFEQGLSRDSRNKTYTIKMMSKHTHFYRDNTLDKHYNQLVGVIDPSRKRRVHDGLFGFSTGQTAIAAASNVLDAVRENVDECKDNINDVVAGKNILNFNVSEIKETRDSFNATTTAMTSQAASVADKYINMLASANSNSSPHGYDNALYDGIDEYRERYENANSSSGAASKYEESGEYKFTSNTKALKAMSQSMTNTMGAAPQANMDAEPAMNDGQEAFNHLAKNSTNVGYSITSITGHIDGVKIADIHTNVYGMKKLCGENAEKCEECTDLSEDSKEGMDSSGDQMKKATQSATKALGDQIKLIEDAAKEAAKKQGGSTGSSGASGGQGGGDKGAQILKEMEKDVAPLKEAHAQMAAQSQYIEDCFNEIDNQVNKGLEMAQKFNSMQAEITPNVDALYNIRDLLKEQFDPLRKVTDILMGQAITDEQMEEYLRMDQETQDIVSAYIQNQNENYDKMMAAHKEQEKALLNKYEALKAPIIAAYEQMKLDVEQRFQNFLTIINGVRTPLIEEINVRYGEEKFEFDTIMYEKINIENAQYMADEAALKIERDTALKEIDEQYKVERPLFDQQLAEEEAQFNQRQAEEKQQFQQRQIEEYNEWVARIPEMEEERRQYLANAEETINKFDEQTEKLHEDLVKSYEAKYERIKAQQEQEENNFFKMKMQEQADFRREYMIAQNETKTQAETQLKWLEENHEWNRDEIINTAQEQISLLDRNDPQYHQKYDAIVSKEREELQQIDDEYKNTSYEINEKLKTDIEQMDREFNEKLAEMEGSVDSEYQALLVQHQKDLEHMDEEINEEWTYIMEMRSQERENLIDDLDKGFDELLDSQDIEKKQASDLADFNEKQETDLKEFEINQRKKDEDFENRYDLMKENVETTYTDKKASLDKHHQEVLDQYAEENRRFLTDFQKRMNAEIDEVEAEHKKDYYRYENERDLGLQEAERIFKEQMQPIEEQEEAEAALLLETQQNEAIQYLEHCRDSLIADYATVTIYTQEYLGYINWLVEEQNSNLVHNYEEILKKEPVFRINRFGLDFGSFGDLAKSIKQIVPAVADFKLQDMAKVNGALSALGLSTNNLGDLLNNATSFLDLSSVGLLGLTSIMSSALKFGSGGSSSKGGRVKYVRLTNDDPNKLKSFEYEATLRSTKFNVVKEHIDNSIITPNKEYFVEHVSELAHESGRYLLKHKTETYIREDEMYTCKTGLELCRIPE